ncbi:MAG: ABC transporter permease [Oscillospiraceae bacterium]|nr:ABC transporter permease [Oscillospiraceae bacterium]
MTVLLNNLKRIFLKPINIILMIVVPIVLNLFFISINNAEQLYEIGVIDLDQSELTKSIVEEIKIAANTHDYEDDIDVINSDLLNSNINMAVRFPENYAQDMIDGKCPKVEIFAIEENTDSIPLTMLIASFGTNCGEIGKLCDGDEDKFYDVVEDYLDGTFKAEYGNFDLSKGEKIDRAVNSLGYLAMGMMFLMSFATTLLLEDKVTRVYSRLLTTPTTRASYLLQHLLSYIIVAAVQVVLIISLLPVIMDGELSFGDSFGVTIQVMLVTLLFATACIAIGLTISRFSKNNVVAGAFVGLVNLPVLMLGGCMWPRDLMPEWLQKVGDYVPTTWFLKAAEEVLYENGMGAAWKELALMGGLAVILVTVSFVVETDDKC